MFLRGCLVKISDGWPNKEDCPGYIAALLNRKRLRGGLEWWAGVTDESQEERAAMESEFLSTLRGLVDQWIDSGKQDGVENAWERSVHWHSDAHPMPLVKALRTYEIRNPVKVLFGPDSRLEIGMLPTSAVHPEVWGLVYPLAKAREKAIFLLRNLVNCPSPVRERLSRCDACGEYFVRVRAPRKEGIPIKHGVFCANCKGKGGARRTVESRKLRTEKKIEWAADAWVKWKPDHRHGKRSEWIARQVTARGEAIKVNWITHHQTEIEAEVERRNHATGKAKDDSHAGADYSNCERTSESHRDARRSGATNRLHA